MSRKNTINFTKKALDNLPIPTGDSRPSYYDEQVNGLLIRVTSKGTKSYMVFRRINGVPKKNTLGTYPEMTIEQARREAIRVLSLISEGINPNKLKKEALSKQILTLEKVFEDYSISKHNLASSTLKNYMSILDNYLNDWKKKAISEITRDMVEQRHRDISYGTGKFAHKDGSPTRANTTMRLVRALFNYAKGQYEDSRGEPLFVHNPVDRITHNKGWNKEKIRQGIVHKYDLKKWYEGVMELPLLSSNSKGVNSSEVARDLLIFILFTGLRRDEALSLKWDDIDFNNHSLTIEDTKNHETHSIPLTSVLLEVLERRKRDKHNPVINPYDNPYVFQGTKVNSHLTPPKKQIEKAREIIGFHFTLHDLRRTFITTAESLDLPQYTLKKLLNHKDTRDVTGGYIITDMERLREPMQRITDELWSHIND
jgi:integrase